MKNFIEAGLFNKIIITESLRDLIRSIIYEIAGHENIIAYAFACYLTFTYKSISYHFYASNIIFGYFAFIKGSSAAGYYHFTHVLNNEPDNILLIEYQLMFYEIPNEVFSVEEARLIAEKILSLNPKSDTALRLLANTKSFENNLFVPIVDCLEPLNCFKSFVEKGRFDSALHERFKISENELFLILRSISLEKNITAYAFLWTLIYQKETAALHALAAEMFLVDFNHLNGAWVVMFFHTHRAAELEPDTIEIQEKLLNLYEPGNASFDVEETQKRAQKVLELKPKSEPALRVLRFLTI